MVDFVDNRRDRLTAPVRKVELPRGIRVRAGIYQVDGQPARTIVTGEKYLAKFEGQFLHVYARKDQIMILLTEEEEDPRVKATLGEARYVGYDIDKGDYTVNPR